MYFRKEWKYNPERKPLVIRGPRQVGKTESIRRFGNQNYKNVIEINFVEEPKYKKIIADGYKTDDIIKNISRIDPGKRFTAGMQKLTPFNEVELSVCQNMFLDFSILGGMPEVVRNYIVQGTFEGSLETQRQLLADYKEDIRKYAVGMDQTRILNVFNQIPIQLAKDNKKFQISKVASGARFKDYRGCIEWLSDAGIINVCYCMNYPELPLKGNFDDTKYKIYFADSGLLVAMLDEEAQDDLRANKNMDVYKGALYENIVGEALVKSGCKLYYYKREDSTLEEDFFVRTASDLIPIEVKATNGRAKSLRTLIEGEKYEDIHYGIKFTGGNVGFDNNIYTFPYFCAFLLKRYLKCK